MVEYGGGKKASHAPPEGVPEGDAPGHEPHDSDVAFDAIVGQHGLKQALLAVAATRDLDGLLVRGEKGTAKSTAVRALAGLIPEQRVIADCPYGCSPDAPEQQCTDCRTADDPRVTTRPVPLVTLPLGATRERIAGTLSVADALDGTHEFDPGLLARANRGILYVDEVNLLDDHLVDVLLDAAASGVNRVERDGISITHPASFTLVGTMNPEEGDLRPQLRDRFALQATVTGCDDLGDRVAIIDQALDEPSQRDDTPPAEADDGRSPGERLRQARDAVEDVAIDRDRKRKIAALCRDAGLDGHRGDIATARAARALAALDGRRHVTAGDVEQAARLALPHRLQSTPFEDAPDADDLIDEHLEDDPAQDDPNGAEEGGGRGENTDDERASNGDADRDGDGGRGEDLEGNAYPDGHEDGDGGDEGDGNEGQDGTGDRAGDQEGDCSEQSGAPDDDSAEEDGKPDDDSAGEDGKPDPEADHEPSSGGQKQGANGRAAERDVLDRATPGGREGSEEDGGSSPAQSAVDVDGQPLVPGQERAGIGEGTAPELSVPAAASGTESAEDGGSGARRSASAARDGRGSRVRTARIDSTDEGGSVDAAASVRAAGRRGGEAVESRDLRQSIRERRASALVLFVVDASASMRPAMRAAKGTVLELLQDAYEYRDEVGFVAFAGDDAEVLLPPTDSVPLAARHLKELPVGDRTPLPAGLETARRVLERADPATSVVVVVTDGRANVAGGGTESRGAQAGTGSPVRATREAGRTLAATGTDVLIVDAGDGSSPTVTETLVSATDGRRIPLEALSAGTVDGAVNQTRE